MKNNNILKVVLGVIFSTVFFACQKDAEIGGTAVQDMAGDWFVRINGEQEYFPLYTYNTADNAPDLMWVDGEDLALGDVPLGIKGKVSIAYGEKSFSGENISNIAGTSEDIPDFSIADGKIVPNGTKGPVSGTPADSIYFELKVGGQSYKVEGYHRTGFLKDDPFYEE